MTSERSGHSGWRHTESRFLLKEGDLVRWNYPVENKYKMESIGLIVADSDIVSETETVYKDVWWMSENRVSPIKVEYLEVIGEDR